MFLLNEGEVGFVVLNCFIIAGHTNSTNGIYSGTFSDSFASNKGGGYIPFTAKFDFKGNIVWGRYLSSQVYKIYGGGYAYDVKLCNDGSIVVCGETTFVGLGTSGVFKDTYTINSFNGNADPDGFVSKLNGSGSIVWYTYYGGEEAENITSLDVDDLGNVYCFGTTSSSNANKFLNSFCLGPPCKRAPSKLRKKGPA